MLLQPFSSGRSPALPPAFSPWCRLLPAAFPGRLIAACLLGCLLLCGQRAAAQQLAIDDKLYHLRNGARPEWSAFAGQPDGEQLTLRFQARANPGASTLILRQQDVKQQWRLQLNGRQLGLLTADEKDMLLYLEVPPNTLVTGENTLHLATAAQQVDDIRVGQLVLDSRPAAQLLGEATLQVEIREQASRQGLPARLTITNTEGVLQPVLALPGQQLAVRPGYVYSGNGRAALGLPAGRYRLYASRGMEYGVDSADVVLQAGSRLHQQLTISRQVPTDGWVSSDTHVHTLTYSGHGDATITERALTLAGEGVELPILTDHNVVVDIGPAARQMGVDKFFTPVSGIETTTPVGHFNIFPVAPGTPVPAYRVQDWNSLAQELARVAGQPAIILNHARDIHADFRPFDPRRHLAAAGRTLTGWQLPANAMEIINSGATQTDQLQLLHDWFGMLNGGHLLTPVGSSDSHDVSRYLVGQGRTYIRSQDQDPGRLHTTEAIASFKAGKVLVGFGLLAEMVVNDRYGPGELAPAPGEVEVAVRVLGPSWLRADKVTLYANGRQVEQALIHDPGTGGVKWSGTWRLPRPRHDLFLVAVAEGPAGRLPFWPVGKPYQPRSPDWQARVLGATGAAWIDGDRDRQVSPAQTYAKKLLEKSGQDLPKLIRRLRTYDQSVALQVASLLHLQGVDLAGPEVSQSMEKASPATKAGFEQFQLAWEESQMVHGP